jgi:hypothetical protein
MDGTRYTHETEDMPVLTNLGNGLLDVLQTICEAEGWTVESGTDEESNPYLRLTPAEGKAGTLRLTKEDTELIPVIEGFYIFDFIPPLSQNPELQAMIISALEDDEPWYSNIDTATLPDFFAIKEKYSMLPRLVNTIFSNLPADLKGKVATNFANEVDWYEGFTYDDFILGYSALNIREEDFLDNYYSGDIPNNIGTIVINNYMWNLYHPSEKIPLITGLSVNHIITMLDIIGIVITEADMEVQIEVIDDTIFDNFADLEGTELEAAEEIEETMYLNVEAGTPWYTGLSRDQLIMVLTAAEIGYTNEDFDGSFNELVDLGEIKLDEKADSAAEENIPWVCICSPETILFLTGRPNLNSEGKVDDEVTPGTFAVRYRYLFSYGTAFYPVESERQWYFAATRNLPGYSFDVFGVTPFSYSGTDEYNESVYDEEGYLLEIKPILLVSDIISKKDEILSENGETTRVFSGSATWGAPSAPEKILIQPCEVHALGSDFSNGKQFPLSKNIRNFLGVHPFFLLNRNWIDPSHMFSGTEYSDNLFLYHSWNGSYTLTTQTVPLTANYGDTEEEP